MKKNSVGAVARVIEKHWLDQEIYPISRQGITKKLTKLIEEFDRLKRTDKSRINTDYFRNKYDSFVENLDILFDVFDENPDHCDETSKLLNQAPMISEDFLYLEDQRSDRKMRCEVKTDKVWEKSKLKEFQRHLKYRNNQNNLNYSISSETISDDDICSEEESDECDQYKCEEYNTSQQR